MSSGTVRAILITFEGSELAEDIQILQKKCKRIGWKPEIHYLNSSNSTTAHADLGRIIQSIAIDTMSETIVLYYGGFAYWDSTKAVNNEWRWHPDPKEKICRTHVISIAPWPHLHTLAASTSGPRNILCLFHCDFEPHLFLLWPGQGVTTTTVQNMELIVMQDKKSEPMLTAGYRDNGKCSATDCDSPTVLGVPKLRLEDERPRLGAGWPGFRGWRTALLADELEVRLKEGDLTAQALATALDPATLPGMYGRAYYRRLVGGTGVPGIVFRKKRSWLRRMLESISRYYELYVVS